MNASLQGYPAIGNNNKLADHSVALRRLCTPGVARTKRLLEWWSGDPSFRERLRIDKAALELDLGFNPDQDTVRYVASLSSATPFASSEALPPNTPLAIDEYIKFRAEKERYSATIRADSDPLDVRWSRWRHRQMARSALTLRTEISAAIVHPPFACELTDGCSVGCWFCGVSAPEMGSQFPITQENARLWQGILKTFACHAGTRAGRWGFLYWASDPLDNPDYERFALEFSHIFGIFPHTTTAQALKDPLRTRALLEQAAEHGCIHNRFSLLSIGALRRLTATFTPEELGLVELVVHTRGSMLRKQQAGRVRDREMSADKSIDAGGETIACVSGFLVNCPQRRVRLISPCPATSRWPLGYRIHSEKTFTSPEEFNSSVEEMIAHDMRCEVPAGQLIRFVENCRIRVSALGFTVTTLGGDVELSGNPFIRELGGFVERGIFRAHEIASYFRDTYGIDDTTVYAWLNRLLESGLVDDDPDTYKTESVQ
jgi:radical SAM family RiPP maturation amino acid epimerase